MLVNLKITNLALIQNCEIDLRGGFSVFTGETGAGKSVLMSSIGLLLGNRADSDSIRNGEESAEVTGLFKFDTLPVAISGYLAEQEIESEEGELIIRRILSRSGRNKMFINQVSVPLAVIKKIGDLMIDLHGQHDHQALLHEDAPYGIIDLLHGVSEKREQYRQAWQKMVHAKAAVIDQRRRAKELLEKREFLQFQYDEISKLELKTGEEEELKQEYALVSSVTDRANLAGKIHGILNGDGGFSMRDATSELIDAVERLGEHDAKFLQWIDDLIPLRELVSDLSTTITSYNISLREEANPNRVDYINGRISKIQRMKKKYMCDFEELILKQTKLEEELSAIENSDSDASLLEKALKKATEVVIASGQELTVARQKAADKFDAEITREMSTLGFNGGGFKTELIALEEPAESGLEQLQFAARTNKGELFMPLHKTASGGEISRIMLAIKTILAEADPVPILVFDEIDTGVGGEIASDIAKAMERLAAHHQIFVISHLQQIATRADHHYLVYKREESGRTVTKIDRLSKEQRITEIARMLGGDNAASRRHAEELLA